MTASRAQPSQRFHELMALYGRLHAEGEPRLGMAAGDTYAGQTLRHHLLTIRDFARELEAVSLLDYGAGKGSLHRLRPLPLPTGGEAPSLADFWGLRDTACYDPAWPPFAARPPRTFDLVIATDVLEHCPQEDLGWILADIFGYARRGVFVTIACYAAFKTLPSGENAHVTVMPPDWWTGRLQAVAAGRPGVRWRARFDEVEQGKGKRTLREGAGPPS